MPEIQIIAKDNHKTLVTTEGTSAKLSEASVVLVKVAASDVLVVNREGTNAVIRLKNGETIVIEGFFSGTAEPKDNSLVFQDENGQLIWAKFKDAENDADADSDADADADSDVEPQALLGEDLPAALPAEAPQELVSDVIYQPISSIEPLLYHDAGVNPWLWAAIPLVAGGIIAAASNHDSNDDSSVPIDTTPPATPSVPSGYLDNVGPDQGIKGSGSSTDDTTPGVVISAPGAGETPALYVDGVKVPASYDPVTGTLTPTTPLADGSHQLTYTLTDAAGNESAQSPALTVTVDTLAPATPAVPSGYLDNVGADQGIKGSGSSTDDTTPGVVISAPGAGETPALYVDGVKVPASYDPVTGTLTPTTPLADGSHQLTYTLTDAAGNESAQSPALTVTVDTLAPATPAVPSGYLDNVGADQGIKGSGSSTDDTTPGVVISAPGAGETPALYVDGVKVPASYDPVTGTLTPTTPLADGSHQLTYTLTDAAGNESAQSPALTVTVDTLAPATPAVPSGYLDNVGADQGIKGSGSSTDDTTPGVVISAPGAGETPALYVDGVKVPASYDPVTGTLTPTTPLADGSHQLTYTLTDAAGNESAQSPALTVTVDTLAPATPAVPSGYLDNVGADQGIKGSGSSTDDTTPGVVISAPGAGETPALYVDGVKVPASYDPVTGTLTPTTPLADGSHQLTYTLTDAAGNESAQSPALTVTVDTLAPATPAVPSGYLDNVGADQGIKGSGSSTDDTTPGVVISAPGAGETPTLYVDGEKVAASYDPVTGTLTPTTPLADGSHQLTYTLTDAAGNESAQSPALLLTVDTTAPGLVITALDPALTATESTTISFTFSEAVSGFDIDDIMPVGGTLSNLVQSTTNPNVWTATFTADGSGAAPSISVADGAYTDLAGNLGTGDVLDGTDGFVVDTLAPAPVITIDPVTNAITIDFGEAVNAVDGSPLTADALEGLLDIANGTLTGLVDNGDGSFSGTLVPAADFEGDVVVNVPAGIVTDVAGNANLTATESLTVDTLAPAFDFTVTINADGTATIAGSTEPGATVEILDPAGNPVAVTVAADGTISGSIASPALAGDYTGTATDVNGNPATDTATAVDTTAPAFDFTVTINADGTATIAGSTEPGATVEILDPAGNPVAVTVAADGTISGSIAAPALAGDYTGTATDVNGNPATDTATAVALDTIDAINDNVTFDPGTFVSTIWDAPIIAQDINVLDTSIIGDTSMNVEFSVPRNSADIGTGHEGDVVIQVSQDNLIAVASGFSVLVEYLDGANWVQYTTATTTNGGLIADALGLGVLGIVDDGKTIAVHLTGVPEGQYRVVVQNDSSAIGDLLDDLTLAQLGDQGILLGADNQDAVLDAVETALNGQVLTLGTLVRNVLEPLLNIANAAGETLAVTDIVAAIVKIPLVGSLLGGVDTVLDYIADALVDNLLSVLEFTNVTINGSETYYTTPQVSGNVFDDNGSGADDRGNSDAALVTKVDGVDVPTDGTDAVIKGLYGTLYINKDGVYRYVLNGSVDSNGQVDDFTYTLSDGTQSDTAVLTISVEDVIAPKAPIVSSLDETTVTGVAGAAEANSVINVYGGTDSDGDGIPDTLLGTTTANPDGSYTVTLNPAIALGDTVVVTSKDAAGNISTPTIASLHNIVALDDPNQTNYELSTTADRPDISGGIFTLANAGVLGDLIDLDLSATSAPGVTVGTNEQITLTLTASGSTGLDISAVGNLIDAILGGNIGGSLDLIIAKQTSTGSYEVYNTIANAYTLNNSILTFTASGSQSISLDDAGVYKFILAPNSSTSSALSNLLSLNLLGNLVLSSDDVVATINNTDLITGNVLSNDTAAPIGLDLSIVSIKETTAGVDETVVSGAPKVIEGKYGTLTIDSTGAYSYQMTANATALGKVEAFTYTVQDNDGHSKQATIYIRLDSNLVTLDWTGKTGLQEADKLVTQLTADNKASAGTVTTLFDQVLNGSGDSLNSIQVTGSNGALPTSPPATGSTAIPDDSGRFTLGAGQTAYISFTSILPSNVTQNFGLGGNQTSAYNVVIELERDGAVLDTQLATWTSTISGTKYYYKVTNTGTSSADYDLNIAYGDGSGLFNWTNTTGKTFGINNIQLDITGTTYTASTVSGDLISNDLLYSSVFKIGVAAGSTTPSNYLDANSTPIVGAYGTLTVNLDGTYSYQANGKIADLGKDDIFTYKIETLDGTVNTQTLTIKVDADNVLIGTPDAGTTGNDIAVSQSANEVFTLGDGADLLIYNVLNGSSPTGGNGTDQWLDFNMSEGDKIDVSSLLSGATTDNINNYLSVSISGNQVTLLVDRDGSGGISTPTALLTLTNEDHATNPITSLVDLLNNNSIIY
ncbi:Ig-like domain-containing protein [Acinetobacter baumannii]|uniref:Ig-like domain-containing protein n=3 Tax=Acinetobacter baumannii TaxID=470 RepID=UPI0010225612|nr:Ig-like domain-containing protein [Acinetobacter baumannii]RYL17422.1 BapA prefix-like domain-containing protein [Acinetobacter baumannii]RYL46628.1 BapA prefix-like domain-containing protein [Acinetobacter baumannii]